MLSCAPQTEVEFWKELKVIRNQTREMSKLSNRNCGETWAETISSPPWGVPIYYCSDLFYKRWFFKKHFKKWLFFYPNFFPLQSKCQSFGWCRPNFPDRPSLILPLSLVSELLGLPSIFTRSVPLLLLFYGIAFLLYSQGFIFIPPLFWKSFNVVLFIPAKFLLIFKDLYNDSSQIFPVAN